jgi:hypothetical protein
MAGGAIDSPWRTRPREGYEGFVRLKTMVLIGAAAAGYYAGTRAGHERYEQINRLIRTDHDEQREPRAEGQPQEKLQALYGLALEWARDNVEDYLHDLRARYLPAPQRSPDK